MTDFEIEIKLKLYIAMLFNIPDGLKRLSCRFDPPVARVLAVFDSPPQDYQQDCIRAIASEVEGHFLDPFQCKVEFLVETSGNREIDLEHLLFARYDADMY